MAEITEKVVEIFSILADRFDSIPDGDMYIYVIFASRGIAILFLLTIVILFFAARRRGMGDWALGISFASWITLLLYSWIYTLVTKTIFITPWPVYVVISCIEVVSIALMIQEHLRLRELRRQAGEF